MDELIRKVLEIENKAKHMVEKEKQKIVALNTEVEQILKSKQKEFEDKRIARVESLKKAEKDEEERKIAELNKNYNDALQKLTDLISRNKELWCNEILSRIKD